MPLVTAFSGKPDMTWEVGEADLQYYTSQVKDGIMTLSFKLTGSVVGGVFNDTIRHRIPDSYKSSGDKDGPVSIRQNGGAWQQGSFTMVAGGHYVRFHLPNMANFVAGTLGIDDFYLQAYVQL